MTIDTKAKRVVFLLIVGFLICSSWTNYLDNLAFEKNSAILKEVIYSLVAAESMNAIVSMLKSIQASIVFLSINPGQLLTPLGSLAEQYSHLLKISAGSVIVQGILIKAMGSLYFKLLFSASGIFLVIYSFFKKIGSGSIALKLFITLCFLRFLALIVLLSYQLGALILDSNIKNRVEHLQVITSELTSLSAEVDENLSGSEDLNNNAALPLSDTQKAELTNRVKNNLAKIQELKKNIMTTQQSLDTEKRLYAVNKTALDKKESGIGFFSSFINNDDDYLQKKNTVNENKERINAYENIIKDNENTITRLLQNINEDQDRMEGKTASTSQSHSTLSLTNAMKSVSNIVSGTVEKVSSKISTATNFAKKLVKEVKIIMSNLDWIAEDMLYIMVAFLFKTLGIPLALLYAEWVLLKNIISTRREASQITFTEH